MSLTQEEKSLVQYGKSRGKSSTEIMEALTSYRAENPPEQIYQPTEERLGRLAETSQDVKQYLGGASETFDTLVDSFSEANKAYQSGEQGLLRTGFQQAGAGFNFAVDLVLGDLTIGAGKVLLSEDQEKAVARNFQAAIEKTGIDAPLTAFYEFYESLPADKQRDLGGVRALVEGVALRAAPGSVSTVKKQVEEKVRSGVQTTQQNIKRITPDALRKNMKQMGPVDEATATKSLTDSYMSGIVADKPAISRQLSILARNRNKRATDGTKYDAEMLMKELVENGIFPKVEGKLTSFDDAYDFLDTKIGYLSDIRSARFAQTPGKTDIDWLKKEAEQVLRQSPQVDVELTTSIKQLADFAESLKLKYGRELTNSQLEQIQKSLNAKTKAFKADGSFKQDTADAIADAVRKRVDELVPTGTVSRLNREIGKLIEMRKTIKVLDRKPVQVNFIGESLGRFGTLALTGGVVGTLAGGPGSLVIAGIIAKIGGDAMAQFLRNRKWSPRQKQVIIDNLKQNPEVLKEMIDETSGVNREVLEDVMRRSQKTNVTTQSASETNSSASNRTMGVSVADNVEAKKPSAGLLLRITKNQGGTASPARLINELNKQKNLNDKKLAKAEEDLVDGKISDKRYNDLVASLESDNREIASSIKYYNNELKKKTFGSKQISKP